MTRKRLLFLIAVPMAFLLAFVHPYLPGNNISACAVSHMLGINCPGCGMIRSIVAVLHGNVRSSVDLNPMGIVAALILSFLWLKVVFVLITGGDWAPVISERTITFLSIAFVGGLFIQWFFYIGITFLYVPIEKVFG